MKKLTLLLLIPLLIAPLTLLGQSKRDASLKSLSLQLQKNRTESEQTIAKLAKENESLSFENRRLIIELEDVKNQTSTKEVALKEVTARMKALEDQVKRLRKRAAEPEVKEVEVLALAGPTGLERFGPDFSKTSANANHLNTDFNAPLTDSTVLLVNINIATERELKMIPGVGGALASKIVNNRPYASVWELMKIEGVGKKRVENLAPYITIE